MTPSKINYYLIFQERSLEKSEQHGINTNIDYFKRWFGCSSNDCNSDGRTDLKYHGYENIANLQFCLQFPDLFLSLPVHNNDTIHEIVDFLQNNVPAKLLKSCGIWLRPI